MQVDWNELWSATASHLGRHSTAGLSALLTEDVLRFAVVQEMVAAGVSPAIIEAEWRRPGIRDSVDLVVTGREWTAIEFKYPREPRETNAPWTQHLGEALKDFYRVATMPPEFRQRWCVQLWSRRVGRYFEGVADRNVVQLATRVGQHTILDAAIVRGLPATATRALSHWMPELPQVTAVCTVATRVSDDLTLLAHLVDAAAPR